MTLRIPNAPERPQNHRTRCTYNPKRPRNYSLNESLTQETPGPVTGTESLRSRATPLQQETTELASTFNGLGPLDLAALDT